MSILRGDGAVRVHPCAGNYMGAVSTVGALLTESDFEGQTSGLGARPGAMMLDYLRVRLPDDKQTWRELVGFLGPMQARGCGWRGWYSDSAMVLEGGLVAWCQGPRREVWGVLVDLPGRACAALGERLVPFLEWCLLRGRVTRADFAIDDRAGRLTLNRILEAEDRGGMVSRWRGLTLLQNRERGKVKGWTVYIGSRRSAAMVRVYDKAGEQRRKGREVPGSWVRLELEAHQDFADALCRDYFERGSVAVVEQVNRRVRFVEVCTDSRARRALPCGWWASFLGSVRPGRSLLAGELQECTIERLAAYVERQAGPAMAAVLRADGGDLARVVGIMERSASRLRPKHEAAIAWARGAVCARAGVEGRNPRKLHEF